MGSLVECAMYVGFYQQLSQEVLLVRQVAQGKSPRRLLILV